MEIKTLSCGMHPYCDVATTTTTKRIAYFLF
jgi:hypothetical protein